MELSATCSMRAAMPYACCGPIVFSVRRTMRSRVPGRMSAGPPLGGIVEGSHDFTGQSSKEAFIVKGRSRVADQSPFDLNRSMSLSFQPDDRQPDLGQNRQLCNSVAADTCRLQQRG